MSLFKGKMTANAGPRDFRGGPLAPYKSPHRRGLSRKAGLSQVVAGTRGPTFNDMYRGRPPWDIGRAQPAFVELANQGLITGAVLDVGCGTGDVVLEMAERGNDAWGIDLASRAIDQAKAKARLRGLKACFLVGDALELEHLNRTFDTVLDCGLFHSLSDAERELYERQLASVVRVGGVFHLMVMSDWEDGGWGGPRRISQAEILDVFRHGWRVDDIQEARFLTLPQYRIRGHAWLATIVREAETGPKKAKKAQANPPRLKVKKAPAKKVAAAVA